jgi:hypothetical protein
MLSDEGRELGTALGATSRRAVGPLLGDWLVVVDGAEDGPPLGLDEGAFIGLSLVSMFMDGKELGHELGGLTGLSDGPLLGAQLLEAEGANDGILLGLWEGPLTGLSLGSMLIDEGPELGTALGKSSGLAVGPLLGDWLVLVDGAEDGLPLGLDEGSFVGLSLDSRLMDGTELGCKLGETTGILDGPLCGAWLVNAAGAEDGILLGLWEGPLTGLSLGSMRIVEGPELGTALGATSRLAIGPLLGDWLVVVDGAEDGPPLGLDEGSFIELSLGSWLMDGSELGPELGGLTGILDGPLLGAWLLKAEGANDGILLGLWEGPLTGLSLGSMLIDEGPELGTALGKSSGLAVGPLLGDWFFVVDGAEDRLPLGLDEGSFLGLSLGSMIMDGTELGCKLGETTGILYGPLFCAWLVNATGAVDGILLGLWEGPLTGLLLGSMLIDEGPELGTALGAAIGLAVGPLLGDWRVDIKGVVDELPLGLDKGVLKGLWLRSMLDDDGVELGVEDWLPLGLDDRSLKEVLLGSRLNVEGKVVGEELGESTELSVGLWLGFSLVDGDGADDELPLAVDDGFEEMGTELGMELDEAPGTSVGPLLGTYVLDDDDGVEDWLPLGLDEGSLRGMLLGSRLNAEGKVVGEELGEITGLFVGPLIGFSLVGDVVDEGLAFGIEEGSEIDKELGVELDEATGIYVGTLLVDGDGADVGFSLRLEDGSVVGLLLGLPLSDDCTELGTEVGATIGIFVGPLLGGWLGAGEGAGDELLIGRDVGPFAGPWLGSLLNDDGKKVGDDPGVTTGISVGPLLGACLVDGNGSNDGLPVGRDDVSEIGTELGVELGDACGTSLGPLLGFWLVEGDGADDDLPLGLEDGSFNGISLGATIKDDCTELGAELGETAVMSVGPLLGFWLVDGDGAEDEIPLGLDDRSCIGILLGSTIEDDGTELGAELGETAGMSVGPLLDVWLIDGDGADDEIPSVGFDDGLFIGILLGSTVEDDGRELGAELGEAAGMYVRPLLGFWLIDGDGADDEIPPVGFDDGSFIGILLGSTIEDDGRELGDALAKYSSKTVGPLVDGENGMPLELIDGIDVGGALLCPMLGTWSADGVDECIGLIVGLPIGLRLFTGKELGAEVVVALGNSVGRLLVLSPGALSPSKVGDRLSSVLLGSWVDGDGSGCRLSLGLDEGSNVADGSIVGVIVIRSLLSVGAGVLIPTGEDEGDSVSPSTPYLDGIDVMIKIGDNVGSSVTASFPVGLVVLDAVGDNDGACVSSSLPNSEGLGVGAGVNVGSAVSRWSLAVGLVVLVAAGDDDGALSKLNWDGVDDTGDTVVDAGDDDGAHVLPPEPSSEGLGVSSGVDVGSAVSCWSLTGGLVVLVAAGDDDGALSKLTCDGIDVAVDIGDTVVDAGDDDGAHVLPPEPNLEGLGVCSRVDVGAAVSCWSFPVGLLVLAAAGENDGGSWSILYSDGSRVVVGSGAEVG